MTKGLDKLARNISSNNVRTAGRIEFVRDQGPLRRDVRVQNYDFDPEIHRNLTKILWAVEKAHSYGMSALRLFSRMPSSDFSPDGLLGGKGYIQEIREMRSNLSQAVEVLSSFSDTIHDEINAPHWKSVDDPESDKILQEAIELKQNPEQHVDEAFQDEIEGDEEFNEYGNPQASNPVVEEPEEPELDPWTWEPIQKQSSKKPFSDLPTDDSYQEEGITDSEYFENTTGRVSNYDTAIRKTIKNQKPRQASKRKADSSIDPGSLPGPRIDHIGPGASEEEFGYIADQGQVPSDDPAGEGFTSYDLILEDGTPYGVTPSYDSTRGDNTKFKVSYDRMGYSWLPGSRNEKIIPIYDPNLSEDERIAMQANDAPDMPPGIYPQNKPNYDGIDLWEGRRQ